MSVTTSTEFASLIHLLQRRAQEQPEKTAYTFLRDGEGDEVRLTYGELETRARAIAAWLAGRRLAGERVLLLYPPGLEYVAAFWGCLYGGAVAVPAYPPRPGRGLERLRAVIEDSQARAALTDAATLTRLQPLADETPALGNLVWAATDGLEPSAGAEWREPAVGADTLAFLQYTSGSTAAPKGVMVTHGNLLHNEEMIRRAFRQGPDSVIVGWLPLYHDMGLIGNVLQPLYVGGRCVLMSPLAFLQKPSRWLQAITRYRATTSGGPNFAYDLCVRKVGAEELSSLDLSSWSAAFNGAEPVRAETLERFAAAFAPCGFRRSALYPCYGLAEATLLVSGTLEAREPVITTVRRSLLERGRALECASDEEDARMLVACGGALDGQRIIVVHTESLEVCAEGEVGEIWVSGPSVTGGYWNRPEETARTFVARHAEAGAGPFLRTGDLGFMRGGELYVAGRLKDLIIIRGRNLYPEDIERVMEQAHAALRPGCGVAFSVDVEGEERLVLAQELERRTHADRDEIIDNIRQALAEEFEVQPYAVLLLKLGSVPKTSSGKLRRSAARELFLSSRFEAVAEWRDEGARDETVAPAFDEAPDAEGVGRVADYLLAQLRARLGPGAERLDALQPPTRFGVDSLFAVELSHRLERDLGVTLSPVALLQAQSIVEAAAAASRRQSGPTRASAAEAETHPLSHGQQALWFLHRMAPDSAAYNIATAMRVGGRLDVRALRRAFETLCERHAALRTTFEAAGGTPVQRVHAHLPAHFEEVDAASWNEAAWRRWVALQSRRPFDLSAGPLLRVGLLSRSAEEHVLLVVAHHVIADFWSLAVLLEELGRLYEAESEGVASNLAPRPSLYVEYVRQQAQMLEGVEGERLRSYWERQLGSGVPALELPYDRPRPAVQTYRGAAHAFSVDEELTRGLEALARSSGATLHTVLLAAFHVLLGRYSGQEEFATGTPAAGRDAAEVAGVVGYFVNPLVIRADLTGDPRFVEYLARVRGTLLDALEHQGYPFPLLVQRLQPVRDAGRTPLFQSMLVMQQAHTLREEGLASFALGVEGARVESGGLVLESVALEQGTALFDLRLSLAEARGGLAASLEYNTDLFDTATAERMAAHFVRLLASIAAEPHARLSELSFLSAAERRQALKEWNDSRVEYVDERSTLHGLFEAQAARTPDAVAVVYEETRLTYAELDRRADELARLLRHRGVGPDTFVALCCERSMEMVVSLLAVLKAGGAYLPLDPEYPTDRIAFMLEESRPRLVLTQRHLRERLPATYTGHVICLDSVEESGAEESRADDSRTPRVGPDNLAYVIYTSGSTGRPKGVMIPHRGIVNRLLWMQDEYGLDETDAVLQKTPYTFDVSVWEFFWPLTVGARLVLARPGGHRNPAYLVEAINAGRVTTLHFVPSMLQLFAGELEKCPGVRRVVCSGEALTAELAERCLRHTRAGLHNLYGPTEASVDVTFWECRRGDAGGVPIGRPLANTQVYVLDERLEPVPASVPGEVYIGGVQLARGYLGRPGLTAERFVPDPHSEEAGARLYKTGDVGRWRADGAVEYLGRVDQQVKIRGFRVEPGEIEAALLKHPSVREAAVVARADVDGSKRLVAYVALEHDDEGAVEAAAGARVLREFVRGRLPEYMVPSAVVTVAALPRTPSGKLDRRALPEVEAWGDAERARAERRRALTPLEETLAGIWGEVLGVEDVGAEESFFALGGHSLMATRVLSRVREVFGVELALPRMFERPTVADMAAAIEEARNKGDHAPAQTLRRASREQYRVKVTGQERLSVPPDVKKLL